MNVKRKHLPLEVVALILFLVIGGLILTGGLIGHAIATVLAMPFRHL